MSSRNDARRATSLLEFVRDIMQTSSPYQPLIIRKLLERGGECSQLELATTLLLADGVSLRRATRVLMRWPKRTLEGRGVVSYDSARKCFSLLLRPSGKAERDAVLAACDRRLQEWSRTEAEPRASRFFAVMEAAGGRCQACGVLAIDRPLDVDHIVPEHVARDGMVIKDRMWIPVDDTRNLQALCSRCNRGKRDASTTDFRPTLQRLAETVSLAERRCEALGYTLDELWELVKDMRGALNDSGDVPSGTPADLDRQGVRLVGNMRASEQSDGLSDGC